LEVGLELTSKQQEHYSKLMESYVYDNAIIANDENAKKVGSQLRAVIEADNKALLLNSMAEKISDYYAKYWEDKIGNPSGGRIRDVAASSKTSGSGLDDFINHINNKYN
jgi:hypothetical protein